MKDELRFVFDTNVLISASLFKASVPRQALDLARRIGKVMMSWPTMAEMQEVLGRKRFDKYITEEERQFLSSEEMKDLYSFIKHWFGWKQGKYTLTLDVESPERFRIKDNV